MPTQGADVGALFLDVSRMLTGIEDLPVIQAEPYRRRLSEAGHEAALAELLRAAAELPSGPSRPSALIALVVSNGALRAVAEQLVHVWYTSALLVDGKLRFGTADQYFTSLLWSEIRAHPPALSGGYMGHWRYLPE